LCLKILYAIFVIKANMKKILLVEDDLYLQRIYTLKLTNNGYQVFLALNSDQALDLAKREQPNLIILDIMIPGKMNGFELLDIFKKDEKTKKIPVIILTNLDLEKEKAKELGASDYLLKSDTDLNDLIRRIDVL